MTDITIPVRDGGSFKAYIAMPEKLPAPAIIVIQEIFGVNGEMRAKCDSLAASGFIAVCPDLFWRLEPGVQLTDKTDQEWAKAFDLFQRFDTDKGMDDLRATLHVMKGHADCAGMVGCVGYCLGGKLAYLMASRTKIDCAVGYYGVGLEELTDEAAAVKHPCMLHIAENDKYVSPEAQAKIKKGVAGNRNIVVHSYPGVDHAFARGGGQHYNAQVASLADSRTLDFFKSNLSRAQAA